MKPEEEIRSQLGEISSLNIATLQRLCHTIAENKGWHEKERTFGDIISLCHSELSEALEEHRDGMEPSYVYYQTDDHKDGFFLEHGNTILWNQNKKPEGIPIELADVIIRILDYCGKHDIDIMRAIQFKLFYNLGREHRHGGKQI